MKFHILLCSLLCITISSHTMEIIKKETKKSSKHNNDIFSHIVKKYPNFPLIQKIGAKNQLPQDIIRNISHYNFLLKQESLHDFTKPWEPLKIPIQYQYLLSLEQKHILTMCFNHPSIDHDKIYYVLESNKNYKIFLTLPIELRKHLTTLPQLTKHNNDTVYKTKIIHVGTFNKKKAKLIVPEKKKKQDK